MAVTGARCTWGAGPMPTANFRVEIGPFFITFYAEIELAVWAECRLALYRYALRQNEEMINCRLALTQAGDLAFIVEWPRDELDRHELRDRGAILLTYYETCYPNLQLIAQDEDVARVTTANEAQGASRGPRDWG